MKKLIGVAALLLTLAISIIYRQLTQAKICRSKVSVPAVVQEVRENLFLASLAIQ